MQDWLVAILGLYGILSALIPFALISIDDDGINTFYLLKDTYKYGKENFNIIGTAIILSFVFVLIFPSLIIFCLCVAVYFIARVICSIFKFLFKKRDKLEDLNE